MYSSEAKERKREGEREKENNRKREQDKEREREKKLDQRKGELKRIMRSHAVAAVARTRGERGRGKREEGKVIVGCPSL